MSVPAARRPGRPRSSEADEAIVRAALELLLEGGYRTLSMEAVRARSGVGKATLYRRYSSKEELVAHVVRRLNQGVAAPDTGSLHGDWEGIVQLLLGAARAARAAVLLPRLLADSVGDPELHAIFYENLVQPRRAAVLEMLRRGVARGELREDLNLELVVDLLAGPYIYRLLISGGDVDQLFPPDEVFDVLMRGLAR